MEIDDGEKSGANFDAAAGVEAGLCSVGAGAAIFRAATVAVKGLDLLADLGATVSVALGAGLCSTGTEEVDL